MKKFWKKKLIFKALVLAFLLSFWLAQPLTAVAADLEVTFESEPLFSQAADGDWYPGRVESRWVQVTNYSSETKKVIVDAFDEKATYPEDLAETLEIVISKEGIDLYGGALGTKYLSDFYPEGEMELTTLSAGQVATYDFIVSLKADLGNEWQGKDTGFDFNIGFKGEDVGSGDESTGGGDLTPTPTPVPAGMIAGLTSKTVVLGEATPAAELEEKVPGEIAGARTVNKRRWWWLLLFLLLLSFIYYWLRRRRD